MKIDRWFVLVMVFVVPLTALIGFLRGTEKPVLDALTAFGTTVWLGCVAVVLGGLAKWAFGEGN